MATTHPELAAEWDKARNPIGADEVTRGSAKKVFWICPKGHSYETTVSKRTLGRNCPACSGQVVLTGYNDLATTHPELAAEWDKDKNDRSPADVSSGSGYKAWWICPAGHSYQSACQSRTGRCRNCSICSNRKVVAGVNDLATTHPELAAEWDEMNNSKQPQEVSSGSTSMAWWICPKGHGYSSVIYSRQAGSGCPVCSSKRVVAGVNDLATTHPELAAEWDKEKNEKLAQQVTAGSSFKAWWICPAGHSFNSAISHRSLGTSCPTCATHGFDQQRPAILYFIKNASFAARKIGITNLGNKRNRAESFGGDWQIIKIFEHESGATIKKLESRIFDWLRKEINLPIYLSNKEMGASKGYTETFSADGVSDMEVVKKIEMIFDEVKSTKK